MLELTDQEFDRIRQIMFKETGVKLRDGKKPLVIGRLRKRVDELQCGNFTNYIRLIEKPKSPEMQYFVDALTTNETFFFRHSKHFNYLYEKILPELKAKGQNMVEIWSGASSTGEEPYSIAITMTEFCKNSPGMRFAIYASDINSEVIEDAKEGIYGERSLKEVPETLRQKCFKEIEGKGSEKCFQVIDALRQKVEYFQHNLQQASSRKPVDVIFLRNVLIYFEKETKEHVVNLLERNLKVGGYFIISLSENLNDIKTSLKLIEAGIFRKG